MCMYSRAHVISLCPALAAAHGEFDLPLPLVSGHISDPILFTTLVLGSEWMDDNIV